MNFRQEVMNASLGPSTAYKRITGGQECQLPFKSTSQDVQLVKL